MHRHFRVVHYNSIIKKKTICYVNKLLIEKFKKHYFADLILRFKKLAEMYFITSEKFNQICKRVHNYIIPPEEYKKLDRIFKKYPNIKITFEKTAFWEEIEVINLLSDINIISPKIRIVLIELVQILKILTNQSYIKKEHNSHGTIKKAINIMESDPFVTFIRYLLSKKYEKPLRERKALSKFERKTLSESAFIYDKYPNEYSRILNK